VSVPRALAPGAIVWKHDGWLPVAVLKAAAHRA
jgi:hypothetical protein